MKIILDIDEEYSKKEAIAYLEAIKISDTFIKSITIEK